MRCGGAFTSTSPSLRGNGVAMRSAAFVGTTARPSAPRGARAIAMPHASSARSIRWPGRSDIGPRIMAAATRADQSRGRI